MSLKGEEKRALLKEAGLAAWKAYEATGLHVTSDEADAWPARLEIEDDAEAPGCLV